MVSVTGAPSSFQRRGKPRLQLLPGTFPSHYTHHVLVSTGIEDLDQLLGGGLPVGSVLLVYEDYSGSYAKLLLKYFLSEGVHHKNATFLASLGTSPQQILNNLPSFSSGSSQEQITSTSSQSEEGSELKIAWRYKSKPSQEVGGAVEGGHQLGNKKSVNLLKSIPKEVLDCLEVTECGAERLLASPESNPFTSLVRTIHSTCHTGGYLAEPGAAHTPLNILRLGVLSLGDVLWDDGGVVGEGEERVARRAQQVFSSLLAVRAILRSCFGVAVITVPHNLHSQHPFRQRIQSGGDYVISLKSFDGETKPVNPAYKDYHGIFRVESLASLGILTPPPHLLQDECEMVFKSRRTGFSIQRFHLPPSLSVTVSRDNTDPRLKQGESPSNIAHAKNIDF